MLAFIFIHLKVFSNFLCDLFDLLLVWVYCLISTYSLSFQFSFSLTSSFLPLQSERTLCMISISFNLLRLPLWTNVRFILKNVPCAFEKIAYSALVGLGVLYMSVWSSWSSVVQVFYFLIDFLSRCSIQHWRWDIEVAMCCYRAVYISLQGFPGGSEGKASSCNVGDPGSIPGLGRIPWRRKWQPTPVFLPGESYGFSQRSRAGYSPQGRKESDTTERLHFHFLFLPSVLWMLASSIWEFCYLVYMPFSLLYFLEELTGLYTWELLLNKWY